VERCQETSSVGVVKPKGRPRALFEAAVQRAEELLLAKDSAVANAVAQQLVTQGLTPRKVKKATLIRHVRSHAKVKVQPLALRCGKPSKELNDST
jgi:hypothetical protein